MRNPRAALAATALAVAAAVIPAVLAAHPGPAGAVAATPPTCKPSGHFACPSPTPTSPSPAPTGPSPSPSPAPTGTGTACVTSSLQGVCGPYIYPGITNSNGYNTYVSNQIWAPNPGTTSTLTAYDPGDWNVAVSAGPAGYSGVQGSPLIQQQMDNWCAAQNTWDNFTPYGCGNGLSDTPVSVLTQLASTYAETMPHNPQTIAQAAWDVWVNNDAGYAGENMIWVDNVNRGSGGADQKCGLAGQVACPVIGGQAWTLYNYGGGENIWSLGAPGTFAQQSSGTVDILALLRWEQANGFMAVGATLGLVNFGWEICSTGGVPEQFSVTGYSLQAAT
jgi:hypothetical protein